MEGKVPSSPSTGLSLTIGRSSRREAVPAASSGSSSAIMRRRVDFGSGKEIVVAGERRNVVEITPTRQPPTARIEEYEEEYEEDEFDGAGNKRKRFHRHSAHQIRELEFYFGIQNHPDEIQRRELGKRVGLSSQQVKFWFQNRRTQTRNLHERNANSAIRNEIKLIKEENDFLREAITKCICINCVYSGRSSQECRLRIQNARLLGQLETIKRSMNVSESSSVVTPNPSSVYLEYVPGIIGMVDKALAEFTGMTNVEESDWTLLMGNGIGARNSNENVSRFRLGIPTNGIISSDSSDRCVDVSRESIIVGADINMLLKFFMDASYWKDMFPGMVSKASTIDVIIEGDVMNNKNGAIQLMVAEYYMLSPLIPTKKLYFVRHCKQMGPKKWAIVDLAENTIENGVPVGLRRRPSGFIIEDKSNGQCKVIWLEQIESDNITIPTNYPRIVSAAFSARHWATALQQHCERLTYMMSFTIPTNDEPIVDENRMIFETLSERINIMNLAHKMKVDFCNFFEMARLHPYSKTQGDEDGNVITFSARKNLNDPGEPIGFIICAVTSVWLPISRFALSDYLRDESHKHEWDMSLNGKPAHNVATLAKGPNQLNSITIQAIEGNEGDETRILQDSSINEFETMLVYASIQKSALQSVTEGEDLRKVSMLASGFSILRDGLELRPIERMESGAWFGCGEGQQRGCLLTLAFQVLASSPMDELDEESVESVTRLVSFTLRNIKEKFNSG